MLKQILKSTFLKELKRFLFVYMEKIFINTINFFLFKK